DRALSAARSVLQVARRGRLQRRRVAAAGARRLLSLRGRGKTMSPPASSRLRPFSRFDPDDRIGTIALGRAFLEQALHHAPAGDAMLVISVAAPPERPERLLRASGFAHAVSWQPADGAGFTALGATRQLQFSGEQRIEQLEREAAALFSRLRLDAPLG